MITPRPQLPPRGTRLGGWALALLATTACLGCANSSSSGGSAGGDGSNDVEPKPAERLSEVAVPSTFDFRTTETLEVEVITAGRHDGFTVVVLEPGTGDYDPHRALSKAKVESDGSFSGTVRVDAGTTSLPVTLYANGNLEFHVVPVVDGRAELSR